MSTNAKPSNNNGTTKMYVNGSPEYTSADKVDGGPGKRIGAIDGRLTRYKSKVSDLNQGHGGDGGRDSPTGADNI